MRVLRTIWSRETALGGGGRERGFAEFPLELFLNRMSDTQGKTPMDGRFSKCGTWMSLTYAPEAIESLSHSV